MRPKNGRHGQEEVIAAFRRAHGDLYDYTMVHYVNNITKVRIGCSVHGWFEQIPKDHKRGIGCAKCGPTRCGESRKVTLDEFIERSRKHHGDKFDYSLVDLVNNGIRDKVQIVCPVHGTTLQQAHHHMTGFGCKKCDAQRIGDQRKLTRDQFIEKALLVHGDAYDYSKVVYTHSKKKVLIVCREHGEFRQEASAHMGGKGCAQCSQSQGERAIALWLHRNSISYDVEKRFHDCLSPQGKAMKFDFYLSSHNVLIEFDGHHHYKEVEYFGYNLATVQAHDHIKDAYAKKKGIPLLRIPFFSLKDVPSLLKEFLHQAGTADS
jgi:hypothetical protein